MNIYTYTLSITCTDATRDAAFEAMNEQLYALENIGHEIKMEQFVDGELVSWTAHGQNIISAEVV